MSKLYSCTACQQVIDKYIEKGGEIAEITPGTLGYGTTICYGDGLKTTIIQEVYVNEWSSAHKIRQYNKMPKKYESILENL